MGIMSKIFGQNSSGENGLSIFARHTATAMKNNLSVHKPWEFCLVTGMGALLGAFLGAAVMTGVMYAEDGSLTSQQAIESRTNAPGIDPGAAMGGAGMFYLFFVHEAMAASLRETRKQIAPPTP